MKPEFSNIFITPPLPKIPKPVFPLPDITPVFFISVIVLELRIPIAWLIEFPYIIPLFSMVVIVPSLLKIPKLLFPLPYIIPVFFISAIVPVLRIPPPKFSPFPSIIPLFSIFLFLIYYYIFHMLRHYYLLILNCYCISLIQNHQLLLFPAPILHFFLSSYY